MGPQFRRIDPKICIIALLQHKCDIDVVVCCLLVWAVIKTKCQRINAQQCSRTKDRRIGWACPTYSTKYGIQGSGVWSWISVELIRGSGLKHTISTSFSDRKEIPSTFSHSIAFHHRWHFLRPVSKEGKPVIYLFIICPLFFLCCSLCGCMLQFCPQWLY